MKHYITLVTGFLSLTLTAGAQTYTYPPNPDFNHDGFVDSRDLLDFLPFFETEWGPLAGYETPDYPFSDFQQAVYDIWNEELQMDSVYLHFRVEAYHEWYPVGDPNLHADTLVYTRTLMLQRAPNNNYQGTEVSWRVNTGDGNFMLNLWHYGSDSGTYRIDLIDFTSTRSYLNSIGFVSGNRDDRTWHISNEDWSIWTMDENGWNYNSETFLNQTLTEFECIPYFSSVSE